MKCSCLPGYKVFDEIRFHDGRTIAYEYDAEERITKVTDSADGVTEYTYDALGQLLTETKGSQTVSVTYDKYGNIQSKNGISYSYGSDDANCCGWKDLLTAYNGKAITYDANGNPINYQGTAATWEKGRQLKMFGANSYKYNNDGIRIQKRTATEIHDYILDGTNIIKELVTDTGGCPKYTNEYLYDLDGTVCGIKHNGTAYYFYKNLQGDVIAITNANGAVVARYTYDAWGVPTIKEDTSSCNIATVNPFRYRGYYYDTETKFYYLQSRYYDPEVGRFINADDPEAGTNRKTVLATNLFAYCENNPASEQDESGSSIASIIWKFVLYALFGVASQFLLDLIELLYRKVVKKEESQYPISNAGDFISAAISWGMCAFDLLNRKIWAFLSPFLPLIAKYVVYIIKRVNFSWQSLLLDLASAFVAGFISVCLSKAMSNKLSKVKKKGGNRYYDFQKYIKKQQKITIAINKRFFKISFSIVVGTSVLQLLLKLLLGLI